MAEPLDTHLFAPGSPDGDFQTQIDDLRLALRDWRRNREYAGPTQERLEQITLQCARLVESWQQMERRRNGGGGAIELK